MARFFFIRHAESGTPGIYYGQSDVPVTDTGLGQERVLLECLSDKCFHAVYSSPLTRCSALAAQVAGQRGMKLEVHDDLAEIHLGDWEGRTFDEAYNLYPAIADQLCTYDPKLSFPGGESLEGFKERICRMWTTLQHRHGETPSTILVFCHAGVIRALLALIQGRTTREFWQPDIPNCSVTIIETDSTGCRITSVGCDLSQVSN